MGATHVMIPSYFYNVMLIFPRYHWEGSPKRKREKRASLSGAARVFLPSRRCFDSPKGSSFVANWNLGGSFLLWYLLTASAPWIRGDQCEIEEISDPYRFSHPESCL